MDEQERKQEAEQEEKQTFEPPTPEELRERIRKDLERVERVKKELGVTSGV
jgi:hypothetical protein